MPSFTVTVPDIHQGPGYLWYGVQPPAAGARLMVDANGNFFFSSRSRHTSFDCDWSSDGALPIWQNHRSRDSALAEVGRAEAQAARHRAGQSPQAVAPGTSRQVFPARHDPRNADVQRADQEKGDRKSVV